MLSILAKRVALALYTTSLILLHPAIHGGKTALLASVTLLILALTLLLLTQTFHEAFRSLLILQSSILLLTLLLTLTGLLALPAIPLAPSDNKFIIHDFSFALLTQPDVLVRAAYARMLTTTPQGMLEIGIHTILLFLIATGYAASLPEETLRHILE